MIESLEEAECQRDAPEPPHLRTAQCCVNCKRSEWFDMGDIACLRWPHASIEESTVCDDWAEQGDEAP